MLLIYARLVDVQMYSKAFIFCNSVGLTKIILFRSEHCLSVSLHLCISSCPSRNILVLLWISDITAFWKSRSDCGRKASLGSRGVIYLTFPKFDAVSLRDHLCLCWLCFSAIVENQVRAALCCQPTAVGMVRVSCFWGLIFRQIKPHMQETAMENTFYHATGYHPALNCYS